MLELCKLLGITVTELLEGEKGMERNEELLLEMVKQKQEADKRLLRMEWVTGFICIAALLTTVIIASYIHAEEWIRTIIILAGLMPLLIATPFMLQIEQTAGYYQCQHCHHCHVPEYKSVFFAMHIGRTRYMKCPECSKRSWQKKVISKE